MIGIRSFKVRLVQWKNISRLYGYNMFNDNSMISIRSQVDISRLRSTTERCFYHIETNPQQEDKQYALYKHI